MDESSPFPLLKQRLIGKGDVLKTLFSLPLLILFICLLNSQSLYAAQLLFSTDASYDVEHSLEVLHDSNHSFNISRLQSDEANNVGTANLWRKFNKETHSDKHSRHVCWFRLSITNVLQQDQKALLVLPNPSQTKISVYVSDHQHLQAYHTGSAFTFSQRPIEHEQFLFPISLPASSDVTVYIKAVDETNSIAAQLELWHFSDYFIENAGQPAKWVFIGALGFCVAFLVANALRRRKYEYLVLALYVFSTLCAMLVYYGYAYRYIWPNSPDLNYQSLYFFVAIAGASLLHFHSDFCRFQRHHHLAYIGTAMACAVILLTAITTIWGPYQGTTRLFLLLGITVIFLIWQLVVLIRHELIGNKKHRSVLFAWGVTFIFALCMPLIKPYITINLVPGTVELIVLTLCLSLTVMLLREGDRSLRNFASHSVNMKVRDELMARMNFEVRTPMNAILGAADLLRGSQLTRSQRQYTELLHVSSYSLLRVVNNILDYSRLKSGDLVLHRKSFDLRALLDEIPSVFSLRASQKNIQLYCHYDRKLPQKVLGDDKRLQQLLFHLLDCAIKSTYKGAVVFVAYPDPNRPQRIIFSLEGSLVYKGETLIDVNKVSTDDPSFDDKVAFSEEVGNNIINQLLELMGAEYTVLEGEDQAQRLEVSIPLPDEDEGQLLLHPLKGLNVGWIGTDSLYAAMLETAAEQQGVELYSFSGVSEFARGVDNKDFNLDVILCHGDELDSESIKVLNKACALLSEGDSHKLKVVALCDSIQALEWAEQQLVSFDLVSHRPVVINQVFSQLVILMQTEEGGLVEQDLSTSVTPSLNILVAEDNEVNTMVLDRMLNRLGHQVSLVKNGALAIELYRHCMGSDERWQHFDLVLMDCEMPEVDGLQATRKIRQLETEMGVNHVPIIALTAHGLSKVESQCISVGMNVVLGKPVSLENLKSAIEKTVDLTQLAQNQEKQVAES